MKSPLKKNPKQKLNVSLLNRIVISFVFFFVRIFRLWQKPRKGDGRFEHMTFIDKLHWLHKSTSPIKHTNNFFLQKKKLESKTIPSTPSSGDILTLCFTGDLMPNELLEKSNTIYEEIEPVLFAADISVGNLEAPVISEQQKQISFNSEEAPPLSFSPKAFCNVIGSGKLENKFNILTCATNHTYDYKDFGINETLKYLREKGIHQTGINSTAEEQHSCLITEEKGFKIGFINFTFGLNGMYIPKNKSYLVNETDLNNTDKFPNLKYIEKQIKFCKQNNCDFIFGLFHWGKEYEFYPTQQQQKLAHHLIELGLDSIVSHHPHVIQPTEIYYPNRKPTQQTIIAYSLGNLINPFSADYLTVSLMLNIQLSKRSQKNSETLISSFEIIPVQQYVTCSNEIKLTLLKSNNEKNNFLKSVNSFRLPFVYKNNSK